MSQLLEFNIPLRLQCYRVPVVWHWKAVNGVVTYRYAISPDSLTHPGVEKLIRAEQFDPWEMRLKFLDVDLRNPIATVSFLNTIGLFAPPASAATEEGPFMVLKGEDGRHPVIYEPERVWIGEEDFWREHDFCRSWPCHLKETSEATFDARIAPVDDSPTQFLTVTNFYDAFQIAFAIDQARRARRAKCTRPNCGKTYTFTGNRKRKYCSDDCGHYMAVKAFRKSQKRKGKKSKVRSKSRPRRAKVGA
jgi:hypothetical protein